jgi:S-adenosylmethionine:tRNA ribosyltransferase-isomerase
MKKSDFNYHLPKNLIAQKPLAQRGDSRLLCVNRVTGQCQDNQFKQFIDLLLPNDLVVFNNTKVIPARLFGQKETGGKIEILIERIETDLQALAHIKASKAPKTGTILYLGNAFKCEVIGREDDLFKLVFNDSLMTVLDSIGHIPLPPYITRADTLDDLQRYQTVFAQQQGAVAAPTAGLHFDETLMQQLAQKKISTTFVTLHVGSGTFQPVRVENLTDHIMHKEYFKVTAETVNAVEKTRAQGGRVIAIGTTVVRALESASQYGKLQQSFGDTQLFITPSYQFKSVDALLTNFHLPESTLLMLVSAFANPKSVMKAYQHAIEQRYRFFSYGDAMFLSA